MEIRSIAAAMEYSEQRFTKRILFRQGDSVMFVLNFLPGQRLPVHTHPGSDVYVTVLEGTGALTVDESSYSVAKGDAVHCSGEQRFSFANDGEGKVSLLVHLSKIPSPVYATNL